MRDVERNRIHLTPTPVYSYNCSIMLSVMDKCLLCLVNKLDCIIGMCI